MQKEVITSAVQETGTVDIINSCQCKRAEVEWWAWCSKRRLVPLVLLTEGALGTGGGHFELTDYQLKVEAALMLS
jgi:hypothetical protein